jgi:hypothetical protein
LLINFSGRLMDYPCNIWSMSMKQIIKCYNECVCNTVTIDPFLSSERTFSLTNWPKSVPGYKLIQKWHFNTLMDTKR